MKADKQWEEAVKDFPVDAPADKVESTASDLEAMNYEPVLLLHTPNFLRMGKQELKQEIERVLGLSADDMVAEGFGLNADFSAFKAKHVQLLLYHYSLLCRLRVNDSSAWDIINELMEDD